MREKLKGLIDVLCAELQAYIHDRATKIISQIPPEIPTLKTNSKGGDSKTENPSPVLSKQGLYLKELTIFYKESGCKGYIQHREAYYESEHGHYPLTLERIKNILMAIDELKAMKNGIINHGIIDIKRTMQGIHTVLLKYSDNNKEISTLYGKKHTSYRENRLVYSFFSSVSKRTVCQSKAADAFANCSDLLAVFRKNHLKSYNKPPPYPEPSAPLAFN